MNELNVGTRLKNESGAWGTVLLREGREGHVVTLKWDTGECVSLDLSYKAHRLWLTEWAKLAREDLGREVIKPSTLRVGECVEFKGDGMVRKVGTVESVADNAARVRDGDGQLVRISDVFAETFQVVRLPKQDPIKPSSLCAGTRIECSDVGLRWRGTVSRVYSTSCEVREEALGTIVTLLDDVADQLAIRILDVSKSDHLAAERDAWIETARQETRNAAYYCEQLTEVAKLLGDDVYICEDGSRSDEPLLAKVADVVRARIGEIAQLRHQLELAQECVGDYEEAKAVITKLSAEIERLRGVVASESLASEVYDEP